MCHNKYKNIYKNITNMYHYIILTKKKKKKKKKLLKNK